MGKNKELKVIEKRLANLRDMMTTADNFTGGWRFILKDIEDQLNDIRGGD